MIVSRQVRRCAERMNAKWTAATSRPAPQRPEISVPAVGDLTFSNDVARAAVQSISRLWNLLVPARALRPQVGATHTTYLHPTKRRRSIANRRLGIAAAA
jgi:hypothetical protein